MSHALTKKETINQIAPIFGSVLVISGIILFIDQRINTNWLTISTPIAIGIFLIIAGVFTNKLYWSIPGTIFLGIGAGIFVGFQKFLDLTLFTRIFVILMINCVSSSLLFWLSWRNRKTPSWWLLFFPFLFLGLGFAFFKGMPDIFDYILFSGVSISFAFLIWGLAKKVIGLIIPGVLMGTISPGVFLAWRNLQQPEGLQSTGTMLVWFSLGWILITIFNRIINKKFTWWPLIPGGILLTVGAGLYIGGNPGNTLDFLGNTGSVGLVLLGIYLILLKFGLQNKTK